MIKKKKKTKQEIINNKINIDKRNDFFTDIWKKNPHKCQVTGIKLNNTINSMYFHHIIPKSKLKEAEFDEENIVILHPDIHAQIETNIYRYDN